MSRKTYLYEMTRPEIEQALADGFDTAVVNFGSTEQHGLHLPMGTDSLWGEDLAERVTKGLGKALQLPGVRIGRSDHHMDFAGSLTISQEAFALIVRDICRSVAHHGFRHIVLIPTHGGNFRPLAEAIAQVQPELPELNLIGWTDLAALTHVLWSVAARHGISSDQAGAHAGENETAMILYLRPELVNMAVAEAGFIGDHLAMAEKMIGGSFKSVTHNGVLGDPNLGNAETGAEYMETLADVVVAYARAARDGA